MDAYELTGPAVAALHRELVALYRSCYSAPPWNEGPADVVAYTQRILDWADQPTFTGVMLRDPTGGLVGLAYGWRGPAEIRGVPLPGIDVDEVFHVADLMVRPTDRGRGLGRGLLKGLADHRRPAALVTHPDADARHLYEATGWRLVGEVTPPHSITWLVYLLDATPPDRRP